MSAVTFARFVPPWARDWLRTALEGFGVGGRLDGYFAFVAEAREDVARAEAALCAATGKGKRAEFDRKLAEAQARLCSVEVDRDVFLRFAGDERMREVYAIIGRRLDEDRQWKFLHSAWAASRNWLAERERERQSRDLAQKIAERSAELVALMDEAIRRQLPLPIECESLRYLLDVALPSRVQDRSDYVDYWKRMRRRLFEELPSQDLRVHWPVAPHPVDVIEAFAAAMERYALDPLAWQREPARSVLACRQANPKTAYLRAFVALLRRDGIPVAGDLVHAVAAVAAVALDDPATDVSDDDVRKVLLWFEKRQTAPEETEA